MTAYIYLAGVLSGVAGVGVVAGVMADGLGAWCGLACVLCGAVGALAGYALGSR